MNEFVLNKDRGRSFTPDELRRIEAVKAKYRTSEARAKEAEVREVLAKEYRETGTLAVKSRDA